MYAVPGCGSGSPVTAPNCVRLTGISIPLTEIEPMRSERVSTRAMLPLGGISIRARLSDPHNVILCGVRFTMFVSFMLRLVGVITRPSPEINPGAGAENHSLSGGSDAANSRSASKACSGPFHGSSTTFSRIPGFQCQQRLSTESPPWR